MLYTMDIAQTLKITSLRDETTAFTLVIEPYLSFELTVNFTSIPLPSAGWSCSFNPLNQYHALVGLHGTPKIHIYDVRNTGTPLHVLDDPCLGADKRSVVSWVFQTT